MRDPALMLMLLREMAAKPDGRIPMSATLRMSKEQAARDHHMRLLVDAGHVEWPERQFPRITNAGYDFIEAADKNDAVMARFLETMRNGIPYLTAVKQALSLFSE